MSLSSIYLLELFLVFVLDLISYLSKPSGLICNLAIAVTKKSTTPNRAKSAKMCEYWSHSCGHSTKTACPRPKRTPNPSNPESPVRVLPKPFTPSFDDDEPTTPACKSKATSGPVFDENRYSGVLKPAFCSGFPQTPRLSDKPCYDCCLLDAKERIQEEAEEVERKKEQLRAERMSRTIARGVDGRYVDGNGNKFVADENGVARDPRLQALAQAQVDLYAQGQAAASVGAGQNGYPPPGQNGHGAYVQAAYAGHAFGHRGAGYAQNGFAGHTYGPADAFGNNSNSNSNNNNSGGGAIGFANAYDENTSGQRTAATAQNAYDPNTSYIPNGYPQDPYSPAAFQPNVYAPNTYAQPGFGGRGRFSTY